MKKINAKTKNKIINLALICVLVFGLTLLAYPTFSELWNVRHQSRAISTYQEQVAVLDDGSTQKMWNAAQSYNRKLKEDQHFVFTSKERRVYNETLDVGDGMMSYLDIPKIGMSLPIYHGTSDAVLQIAVGHLEGSSLPVGGKGTHTVLTGHRGLPSSNLFTDIVELELGDTFMLRTLGKTLTYEVDQITTVLPTETESLLINPNADYCTLVTCTPLGINTHRYLVRGHRVKNLSDDTGELANKDTYRNLKLIVAAIILGVIAAHVIVILLVRRHRKLEKARKKKKRKKRKTSNKKKVDTEKKSV